MSANSFSSALLVAVVGREGGREGGRRERREGAQLPPARGRREGGREGRRADERRRRRRGTDKEGENQSTNNNKVCDGRTDADAGRGRTGPAAATARRSARGWRCWRVGAPLPRDNSPRMSLRNSSLCFEITPWLAKPCTRRQSELFCRFCKLNFESYPNLPCEHGTRQ